MNNIYLPDGFPNTPDVKDLGGQYTAGDGIAFGSDGSINVDYGPGVTMTSVDKLTIDYGPGLDMTTTDKLTIKAGNGLQLSGEELAAKIGNGMKFSEGEIALDYTERTIDVYDTTAAGRVKRGDIIVREYSDHVDLYVHAYNLNISTSATTAYLYVAESDYLSLPEPARYVENYSSGNALCIGYGVTYKNWSTYAATCLFGYSVGENGQINITQSSSVAPTEVVLFMTYKKEVI